MRLLPVWLSSYVPLTAAFLSSMLMSSLLLAACAKGHDAPPPTTRRDASVSDSGSSADTGSSSDSGTPGDSGADTGPSFDAGPTCPTGQAFCDGACRDLQVDPSHCGGCAVRCEAGSVCSASVCMLSCPGGTTACGGGCVDTSSDEANCGACGTICGAGEACMAGACVSFCASGEVYCTDRCVDTSSDAANCAGCGLACVRIHATAACVSRSCRVGSCDSGFADCDGNDANGCERAVSCASGSSCTTSCGTTGSRACSAACSPSCGPPAESCNAKDDDCDGSCDELGGCRTGIYRSFDPTLPGGSGGHIYTKELAVATESADRVLEQTNFFYVYSSDPGGFRPLYRCRLSASGATNFLATSASCEGAGVVVETLGYIAPTAVCGGVPLYRLYSASSNDHFYTPNASERDSAITTYGYTLESTVGYVFRADRG
jgi:hypothetical protein